MTPINSCRGTTKEEARDRAFAHDTRQNERTTLDRIMTRSTRPVHQYGSKINNELNPPIRPRHKSLMLIVVVDFEPTRFMKKFKLLSRQCRKILRNGRLCEKRAKTVMVFFCQKTMTEK